MQIFRIRLLGTSFRHMTTRRGRMRGSGAGYRSRSTFIRSQDTVDFCERRLNDYAYHGVIGNLRSLRVRHRRHAPEVDLENPLTRDLHRLVLHDRQRIMRGPPGPEAVGAAHEALLLYGFQHHGDRALYHLVLEGGKTGAKYALHRTSDVAFPFEPLDDDEVIELGSTVVRVLHTPGHTAESISLLMTDLRRCPEPWFVCTGDPLFVGAVGRPDLPGREHQSVAELRCRIREKNAIVARRARGLPAHFASLARGAGIRGKPASTLAFEKRWNVLLGLDEAAFIEQVTASVPAKPAGMPDILRFNQDRRP